LSFGVFLYRAVYMSALARLALLALVLLTPPSHADTDTDTDYAVLARDSSELRDSVLRAATMIVYARSEESRREGIEGLENAALRGSELAAHQLALGHLIGAHGLPVDLDRSRRYFEMSVRQESTDALLDYGLLLVSGHRFEADAARGHTFIRRAADLGHPSARTLLIEELEAAGDELSLAMADAWRQRMGVTLGRNGVYIQDRNQYAAMVAAGYAVLSEYFTDGIRVPADIDRAERYASMIPKGELGRMTGLMASRYSSNFDLRANHKRARAVYENAFEQLDGQGINNYAWLLATSPDAEVRDGETAVKLMEELLATERRNPAWVDTLAAAYAEIGNFDKAVEIQDEALTGFEQGTDIYERAADRRDSYAEGQAWRE